MVDEIGHVEFSITKTESGIDKERYIDVYLKDGRKFELKNFAHYGQSNRDRVVEGLKADVKTALSQGKLNNDTIIEGLDKIHVVFRGSPDIHPENALKMLQEMKRKGLECFPSLATGDGRKVKKAREHFEQLMNDAIGSMNNPTIIPIKGQIVAFQGKKIIKM